MSFKSKNLSYESKDPPFLRALRAQQAGSRDTDRHERPVARPTGKRIKTSDADEDAPTYVVDDGSNTTLSKEEYQALVSGEGLANDSAKAADADTGESAPSTDKDAITRKTQEVSEVGSKGRKRKAARIVGGNEFEVLAPKTDGLQKQGKPAGKQNKEQSKDVKRDKKKVKTKAAMLSFGGDQDDDNTAG